VTALPTTALGRTGLETTRLGLGLAAMGRPAYINLGHAEDLPPDRGVDALERRAHHVLDAAYEAGIRYFDAARSYGRAEAFLGGWLAQADRDGVTVGSKWGYEYTGGWRVDAETHEVKDLSAEQLRRQLAETRALLGDHLDLYQIHSATVSSGVLENPEVRAELDDLRASGVAIGLTTTGADQHATIDRALEVGGFDSVQSTWNLLERSAGPALARAHAAGLGVIVKEALANGRLTSRGAIAPFLEVARARGTEPDALALAAVLAQPWADVVLSGVADVATLRSNLGALDAVWDGTVEAQLVGILEEPDAYWATRAALPWV
jgi:aryl-alcohol dehydrogenase-like predicted oxidoreductase